MPFCTNCGQTLPDGAKFCSSCGTAVTAAPKETPKRILKESTAVQELVKKIQQHENDRNRPENSTVKVILKNLIVGQEEIDPIDQSIANAICNARIPNTLEDASEFLSLVLSNIGTFKAQKQSIWGPTPSKKEQRTEKSRQVIFSAWASKANQVYKSAELAFGESDAFFEIEEIYDEIQYQIKKVRGK